MKFAALFFTSLGLLLASALPALAATTTYTTQSTWQAAIRGEEFLEDFNAATVENFADPFSKSGFTHFTIAGNTAGDTIGIQAGTFAANTDGTQLLGWSGSNAGPTFTFTFDNPIKAFAFDWKNNDGTDSWKVTIDGTDYTKPPFSFSSNGFWGIISDDSFTTVTFTQVDQGGAISPFGVDNVRSSTMSVSQMGTGTLLGFLLLLAGAGLFVLRRRTR